ncbi:uncharacterized protein B0P05DRAFT_588995 [Gilbertella persicaria]|uniref:uncharacterized protein n=1 Tax=Gilbertella persicaria TaxID=101096 RepID=UPI0022205E36|nr:uncharacterized protein B0P05DRAFT_588995 [Gilbertella persicaria]KAI8071139.1 hypothetical protein B0P05DRAFT_588995 [Gilbertella persicaria]
MTLQQSLCVGSLVLGQDFKWQDKTSIDDLCLFHSDPDAQVTRYHVSFALKGIIDTKALNIYMYEAWRWEAYPLDAQDFFISIFRDDFDESNTTKRALVVQMNSSDSQDNLLLYGEKKETELTMYAHRIRHYHEFLTLPSIEPHVADTRIEQGMIEAMTRQKQDMPLPIPTKPQPVSQVPSLPPSQPQNPYKINKSILKQCIKHELAKQGTQDTTLSQVIYTDILYHYKQRFQSTCMTEQQLQVATKYFVDHHLNFNAMLTML